MNGPQHYRVAESLLAAAEGRPTERVDRRNLLLTAAQVHATLAHVAALVEAEVLNRRDDWSEAIS